VYVLVVPCSVRLGVRRSQDTLDLVAGACRHLARSRVVDGMLELDSREVQPRERPVAHSRQCFPSQAPAAKGGHHAVADLGRAVVAIDANTETFAMSSSVAGSTACQVAWSPDAQSAPRAHQAAALSVSTTSAAGFHLTVSGSWSISSAEAASFGSGSLMSRRAVLIFTGRC
jgi:hypothetical protein